MSDTQNVPAGWSLSQFKAVCADVGSWTWGTVQGAFNEKASLSQIIVDAVIGMIPLVGDATAVRDLIAVVIGLADSEEKRNSKWQWVLLVVLVFALIPVIGGVIKGVGRITLKFAQEAAQMSQAARLGHLAAGANEVIEFLNRIGVKNAEQWLLKLRITDHLGTVSDKLKALVLTLDTILAKCRVRVITISPSLTSRIDSIRSGLAEVSKKGQEMIPAAVKEFDQQLREIQAYIRSGGESTNRLELHRLSTGKRVTTLAQERRLVEDGVLPMRTAKGGFAQNPNSTLKAGAMDKFYSPKPGYPSLLTPAPNPRQQHDMVAAFAGKMINRRLKNDEQIFRFFGKKTVTHGVVVRESAAGGGWWGLGSPPKTAKEWREYAAVLDSFNGDGCYVTAKVVGNKGPKAVVGTVSEQYGVKIPGQYLPGGATQAFFYLDRAFSDALSKAGSAFVFSDGKTIGKMTDPVTGMEFTFHLTGWTDSNGIWGYLSAPGTTTIQTARVGSRERATKENKEVTILP